MTDLTFNIETAPGYQVLATVGKKILRPGGRSATKQLFEWADFKPGETVLELASSFGYSAIALAKAYNVRVVGVEKNPESVDRARANIAAAGLASQVEIIQGNIFHLDQISEQFDYVLAEAILTMQSPAGKAEILSGVRDRLKPGGTFLSHEVSVKSRETEIHHALSQVIRVNATPLSETDWLAACEAARLPVKQHQTRAMGLLNGRQLLQDEGVINTTRIVWNILTNSQIRERVLAMRRVFQQYHSDLQCIILAAQRSDN